MNPLMRELISAQRLAESPVMAPILAQAGLDEHPPRWWGIDWVEVADDLHYRPLAEGGRAAAIIGVWQEGGLIDLLATSLETRAMRCRKGLATLLGQEQLDVSLQWGKPLAVFTDGVSWLAHGGKGIVILDWRLGDDQLFSVPSFSCQTAELALRLKRLLDDGWHRPPPIFVPTAKERRDAA
jgi:hypothetical protein